MTKNPRFIVSNVGHRACFVWYRFPSSLALTRHENKNPRNPHRYYGLFTTGRFEFDEEPGVFYKAFCIYVAKNSESDGTLVHECSHAAKSIYAWHNRRKLFPKGHDKDECIAYITEAMFVIYKTWESLGFPNDYKDGRPFARGTRILDRLFKPSFWKTVNASLKGLNK